MSDETTIADIPVQWLIVFFIVLIIVIFSGLTWILAILFGVVIVQQLYKRYISKTG